MIYEHLNENLHDYKKIATYINHDQKNLLTIIRSKVELQQYDNIIDDIENLNNSINDILTISTNKTTTEKPIVDLAIITAQICDDYRKVYPQIEFIFDELLNYEIRGEES